ncbi:galactose mutarotase [Metabacillus sp. GX 13764]|uniref:aldose epimerase family protein n=1 Tax=Metabacillus kandeliae TaxID=2900151 RepID=UPI001E283F21|nr:aldose epimerase family protein [Metabacillus kandeliae]MCD7035394.1 galactose mutarotase [Metabacillus kandeliae]
MKVSQKEFGKLGEQTVTAYHLENSSGMTVSCLNYGCVITDIQVPDKNGQTESVVLGFDTIEEYEKYSPYFGAVVGRHAGRIAGASFTLDDKTFTLAKNENGNHLHGGQEGFNQKLFEAEVLDPAAVRFTYKSPDGEEGYPGNLTLTVTYTLTEENALEISYEAVSDQKTVFNVTNHSYFNLSGNLKRDTLEHALTLKSNEFLQLDEELIPTGEILQAEGTPFDFSKGRKLKDGAESDHPQNVIASRGYDHPFLLAENGSSEIVLQEEESGRSLIVETDQPAVVLYSGTQLEGGFSIRGKAARKYLGVCLETQGFPDSLHHANFPDAVIEKDEVYRSKTTYRFEN